MYMDIKNKKYHTAMLAVAFVIMMAMSLPAGAQKIGLRTSMTMWATLTPNIEVSYKAGEHVTLHFPFYYNPWIFKENSRFQQVTIQPGARYWVKKANVGWFASGAVVLSRFHVGGWFNHKYRYDGRYYGLGAGGGYAWILSKRLNLEVEGMVGPVYANYDKCSWESHSRKYSKEKGLRFLPLRADVSLVWFLK